MLRKLFAVLIIFSIILGVNGCTSNANETVKLKYLTPIEEGTPIGEFNTNLTEQLMAQKDVQGVQFYEHQEIIYGDITFKSGVKKKYANQLIKELLTLMKPNYPDKSITVQALSDGQVIDSIEFKPNQ